jgi:polyphosphate kinase
MIKKIVKECLHNYLTDNTQSWILQADGSYKKNILAGNKAKSAQQSLLKTYTEQSFVSL